MQRSWPADILISPVSPDTLTVREFSTGTLELLDRLEPSSHIGMTLPSDEAVPCSTAPSTPQIAGAIAKVIRDQFITFRGRVSVLDLTVPSAVAYKKAATAQMPVHWIDAKQGKRHDAPAVLGTLCRNSTAFVLSMLVAEDAQDEVLCLHTLAGD